MRTTGSKRPLREGKGRNSKGIYRYLRSYEEPKDAEVVINTADLTAEEAAQQIFLHLEREGFIGDRQRSRMMRALQQLR